VKHRKHFAETLILAMMSVSAFKTVVILYIPITTCAVQHSLK